jgi:FkbM family methyltransferase
LLAINPVEAMAEKSISYAQCYEDVHLQRCFEKQQAGFYIDVGAGHPVHSNVSFQFYLRGWNGITVEPNPWLTQLSEAVRPRDRRIDSLLGAEPGHTIYHLVDHFHGLSTTLESHARAVRKRYGKAAKAFPVPVTTLKEICRKHAPKQIDFLKIDVEGAEQAVLLGNDWRRFRPKVVVAEALVPITMAPAWESWESILTGNGYRFAFFDKLNRYYVAEEHAALARLLAAKPRWLRGVAQFHKFGPALDDASHPDHRLAVLFKGADMIRLPLLGRSAFVKRLTADLPAADLNRPAKPADAASIAKRLFGDAQRRAVPELHRNATIRDVYAALVTTEQFQAACGRISASYAW